MTTRRRPEASVAQRSGGRTSAAGHSSAGSRTAAAGRTSAGSRRATGATARSTSATARSTAAPPRSRTQAAKTSSSRSSTSRVATKKSSSTLSGRARPRRTKAAREAMLRRRRRTVAGLAAVVAATAIWTISGEDDVRTGRAPTDPTAFIEYAVVPAQEGMDEYDVPASVALAQAIVESHWAKSELTVKGRNYFGIKCSGDSPYATGCMDKVTQECTDDGACHNQVASFRTYGSAEDSFRDHGHFLATNSRYETAFEHVDDPDRFAKEVAKAGYATDPAYADKLIELMQQYDLYQYDET
ncbi:glucosaminidase domain-containing protein [Cumulibacter manganitolerans]|uniref:glucosaminidase domain-containing protein n=1 Tax=Cumulibacter manganitolerans TaxID=1884992 RepID=UPI0018862AC0|nr:glucosaminidase domain-containing protein [Cumulibacter manganitolerans]